MPGPLRRTALHLANLLSLVTPTTRLFRLRAAAFRLGGVHVDAGARICGQVKIDNHHVWIGAGTWIGGGARIIGGADAPVRIGRDCDLGPQVLLVVGSHLIGPSSRRAGQGVRRPITIGDGTWLAAGSTVLGGVRVGSGVVVGARALVVKDVPDDSLAMGVPALATPIGDRGADPGHRPHRVDRHGASRG